MTNTFGVVILNWNGAEDTIECIRSILSNDPAALPVVVDNGSTDDSVKQILSVFGAEGIDVICGTFEELRNYHSARITESRIVLVRGDANLGFAGGCNFGLKLVAGWGIRYTVFLNNDTVVESSALSRLVNRLTADPSCYVTLPQLTVHGTDRIWNCGGQISSIGFRRYFFVGALRSKTIIPEEIVCSFFTGCCFAVLTADFMKRGGFCEHFFFGEEDFELSLWMKDRSLKAICLTSSVVHHKVSASISRAANKCQASKVYIHYLNRFIHMRHRFGRFRWWLWLTIYTPYIVVLFAAKKVLPISQIPSFMVSVIRRATRSNKVTRSDFESIMETAPW